jgi:iron complex transport system permease protein
MTVALASPAARRMPWLMLGLALLLAVLTVLHISVGTVDIRPAEVVAVILGQPREPLHAQIVWDLRLPRALVALAAGAMLGTAGAILQLITRNPLAEPGLMGVAGGAVLAIVLVIVGQGALMQGIDTGGFLPLAGVAGGLAAGLLTYALSLRGGSDPARLVLMGVLVAGVCSALTTVILMGARETDIMRILRWTVGTTNGRVWVHLGTILPYLVVGMALAIASAGLANALQLGDQTSRGLGLRVEPARAWLLLVAAILTAGAVAVVGAIGLIGLIGPHMARSLVGQDARRLFPMAALVTGAVLLAADILARILSLGWLFALTGTGGGEAAGLPVGAVTALLGVPFFLYLLLRLKGSHA